MADKFSKNRTYPSLTQEFAKNIAVNATTKEINGYQPVNHPRLR